jgi:hypothetical protein
MTRGTRSLMNKDEENAPLVINTRSFNQNITKMELEIESAYKNVINFGAISKPDNNASTGEIGGGGNFVKL